MSDIIQLARALQNFPAVKSVGVEDDTVVFFVDDENIASVLRNLQAKIDVSSTVLPARWPVNRSQSSSSPAAVPDVAIWGWHITRNEGNTSARYAG
jgi:hypothetical protein